MPGFFSAEPVGWTFAEFGPLHWVVLLVVAGVVAATIGLRKRLRAAVRLRRMLPVVVMVVAVVLEVTYHLWTLVNHLDFLFNLVPLELCAISLWLSVALLITRSQAVFEIYYFVSVGALAAILFPAFGGFGPDHVRFWHYFFVHSYVLWLAIWYIFVERYRLGRRSLLRLLAVGIPFVVMVRLIDAGFNVNYMYLLGPSATSSPLDFLGAPPWYFVKLLALAVAIFGLMYVVAPKKARAPIPQTPSGESG